MNLLKRILRLAAKLFLGLVVLFVLLLAGLFVYNHNAEVEYRPFTELASGDGRYVLEIALGNPVLAFGPHAVRITVRDATGSGELVSKRTRLSNDGTRIGPDNIRARWIDAQTVRVCLQGDEQEDAVILVDVSARTLTEIQEPC